MTHPVIRLQLFLLLIFGKPYCESDTINLRGCRENIRGAEEVERKRGNRDSKTLCRQIDLLDFVSVVRVMLRPWQISISFLKFKYANKLMKPASFFPSSQSGGNERHENSNNFICFFFDFRSVLPTNRTNLLRNLLSNLSIWSCHEILVSN